MERRRLFELRVDAQSVRVISATLHLAQRVGRDVIIEVEAETLTIRSLNDTKSAFIAVEFDRGFFDAFHLPNRREPFSCKVASKAVCAIMRNFKTLRHLVVCAEVVGAEHELAFQFTMQSGLVRSHRFHYMDCEILNAVFDDVGCNYAKVRPKVLSQLFEHLHRSPEVLLSASPQNISVRSFHGTGSDGRGTAGGVGGNLQQLSTGLTLSAAHLDAYDFLPVEAVEMVFSMREVAALVGFCEAIDASDCDMFFSEGGRAMKLGSKQDFITVTLVLATVEHTPPEALQLQGQAHGMRELHPVAPPPAPPASVSRAVWSRPNRAGGESGPAPIDHHASASERKNAGRSSNIARRLLDDAADESDGAEGTAEERTAEERTVRKVRRRRRTSDDHCDNEVGPDLEVSVEGEGEVEGDKHRMPEAPPTLARQVDGSVSTSSQHAPSVAASAEDASVVTKSKTNRQHARKRLLDDSSDEESTGW